MEFCEKNLAIAVSEKRLRRVRSKSGFKTEQRFTGVPKIMFHGLGKNEINISMKSSMECRHTGPKTQSKGSFIKDFTPGGFAKVPFSSPLYFF